jgi:hypothetical protein
LKTHPRFDRFAHVTPREDLAISTRVFTRRAVRRILEAAFAYAHKHGYPSVTVCEKPNVHPRDERHDGRRSASNPDRLCGDPAAEAPTSTRR